MTEIDKAVATSVKTGKVFIGANSTIESAKTGKTKLVILAADCPGSTRRDVEYYCGLSEVPVIIYEGSSKELATVCGRPFLVSALSIKDPGDSEILKVIDATEAEEPYGGTE